MTEKKLVDLAARWGIPIDTTPTLAILGQVNLWAGVEYFYRQQVAALQPADFVWNKTREKVGGDDGGVTHAAEENAWIALHDKASRNLVQFSAEALRAGIEERRVRLAESQGAMVAEVLRAVAARLKLTAEQMDLFIKAVPEELRRLSLAS